jgi:hypothetical protein
MNIPQERRSAVPQFGSSGVCTQYSPTPREVKPEALGNWAMRQFGNPADGGTTGRSGNLENSKPRIAKSPDCLIAS